MVTIRQSGNYSIVTGFLEKSLEGIHLGILDKYGKQGVAALQKYTPKHSGKTADSWSYEIVRKQDGVVSLEFHNTNINDYVHVAIILQYGHASRNGTWVEGRDYINPAIGPIFEKLANDVWTEVKRV